MDRMYWWDWLESFASELGVASELRNLITTREEGKREL